jgi:hypothetical protein
VDQWYQYVHIVDLHVGLEVISASDLMRSFAWNDSRIYQNELPGGAEGDRTLSWRAVIFGHVLVSWNPK